MHQDGIGKRRKCCFNRSLSRGFCRCFDRRPPGDDRRDQVLWAGFDKLELEPSSFKHVLLLGYSNGFQVLDVDDASNVCELVSKRDSAVTFLQMQPTPAVTEGSEGFRASHPLLLVVAGDETNGTGMVQGGRLSALIRENSVEPQAGNCISTPTVVRFFSLKSHSYVHVLRFRSAVYIVRCSPRIVAVALAAQIYCFDAVTLENKFSVLTYPLQGGPGVNVGCGPMAVGPRWLGYASNNPLLSNTGRLSPQNLTPSPGVSPSTSPGSGSLVARYAMESSKQLAAGLLNLGDVGYKTLSKYCHDLLPDGSTSPLGNSNRMTAKQPTIHPSEADNAGIVVIKDFISKEVISQFRAHTSPISALCFDPSGTLLVTASVHGHNINVFRIIPNRIPNSSNPYRYDWTSAHTHLYKLYRGLTTAVIQDICFSHFSQWVAIVSSRGTCHIFVLSPFGGDASLQPQSPYSGGPVLIPNLTSPWWSSSPCMTEQQFLQPPPAITLSVISRIKNNNFGWLNTVSSVAASATGKASTPSGAIAAVFHNSVHNSRPANTNASWLERILVYSPSGHVIQYELQPSLGVESYDSTLRIGSGPLSQLQDEELHVKAEPIQWWDVCRRSIWPEREEDISKIVREKQQLAMAMDTSDCEGNGTSYSVSSPNTLSGKDLRPHWYLSNAEVLISSGRIPLWQKSKICFYTLVTNGNTGGYDNGSTGGEVEIEKFLVQEIEIRRKDLLPVFEQFHTTQPDWNDRSHTGGKYHASVSDAYHTTDKFVNNSVLRDAKSASSASGLSAGEQLLEKPTQSESINSSSLMALCDVQDESFGSISADIEMDASPRMPGIFSTKNQHSFGVEHAKTDSFLDSPIINHSSSSRSCLSHVDEQLVKEIGSLNKVLSGEVSDASITNNSEHTETDDSCNSVEFTQYFQEGYCKVSEFDDCRELTEAVTDADSCSSHCEREKPEEEGDNDDMLGGVFAFCEEG